MQHHFEWLNPDDSSENARIFDYGDLFREVADALLDVGLPNEAFRFYSPIQQTAEYADLSYFMAMANCCVQLDKLEDAEAYYLTVAENDTRHMECRVRLATLYEGYEMNEEALKYINEALLIGRQEGRSRKRRRDDNRLEQLAIEFQRLPQITGSSPNEALAARLEPTSAQDRPETEQGTRTDDIQFLHEKLKELHPFIKGGDPNVVEDWLDIADALLRDFRTNRIFYPMARTMEFQGYIGDSHSKGQTERAYFTSRGARDRYAPTKGNGYVHRSTPFSITEY